MTTKADFTEEEWAGIARAPIVAGAYIAASDMSMFGLVGEMRGLYEAVIGRPVPEAAAELVGAVIADIKASDAAGEQMKMPETKNSATAAAQLLHQIGLDLEALDRKAAREEASGLQGMGRRHGAGHGRGWQGGRIPRDRGRPGQREGAGGDRHAAPRDGPLLTTATVTTGNTVRGGRPLDTGGRRALTRAA